MHQRTRARLQLLGAAFLFSTGGAAIKATAFTSWQVAGLRSGVAALALWALVPASRRLRGGGPVTLLTALAYAATLTLYVLANKLTTAANTIFLQSTAPLYILLLGPLLLRERITGRDLAFMAAVAGGMGLFFVGRQVRFATAPDPFHGNLLAACSGFTYAGMIVGFRWMGARGRAGAGAVALGNVGAFLIALPFLFPLGHHGVGDWALILYLGTVQIGVAYDLFTRAMPHIPALEASLLLFLEPALNPVITWAVHGEYPGRWALLGGIVIIGATASKAWLESRRLPPAPVG